MKRIEIVIDQRSTDNVVQRQLLKNIKMWNGGKICPLLLDKYFLQQGSANTISN